MAKNGSKVENKIVETVRQSPAPQELSKVVSTVSNGSVDARAARAVIRSLIDRGVLQVTVDWKLTASRAQD